MYCRYWLLPMVAARTVLAASLPVRVISFNIRYAAKDRETNELPWWASGCSDDHNQCRFFHLSNTLGQYVSSIESTVIGLQEAWNNQLDDVLRELGPSFAHIGVGRDDGNTDGEYCPIIYNTDHLSVVFSETKWLSPTPDEVSYGWDAGSRRIVTIGVFEHKATGKRFLHANTHLDNVSGQARDEGINVVVERMEAARNAYGPLGVTLTGDFNTDPNGDAYITLNKMNYVTDSWTTAEHVGSNQLTYTGFSDTGYSRIDFVWYGPNDDNMWTENQTEIVGNNVNGVYISDHRLVYADLNLN